MCVCVCVLALFVVQSMTLVNYSILQQTTSLRDEQSDQCKFVHLSTSVRAFIGAGCIPDCSMFHFNFSLA